MNLRLSLAASCRRPSLPRPAYRRALATSIALLLGAAVSPLAHAADGTWVPTAAGTQIWATAANWTGNTVATGVGGTATFNVNIPGDQNIQLDAGGRTIGNLLFRDTDAANGGFGLGVAGDGALTLDVTSGRSVINVAALGSGKKLAINVPIINNDGILKIGVGELSIRADSPNLTSDLVIAGGTTNSVRVFLSALTALQVTNGATFVLEFTQNAGTNINNLINSAAPLTLGGTLNTPPTTIPATLPLAFNTPVLGNGGLTFQGKSGSNDTQTFNGLALNAGNHTISVSAGTSATLTLGAITRPERGGINFTTTGASTINTTNANAPGGILGGWATFNGNTWVVSAGTGSASGAITALGAGAYSNTWATSAHTDVTASIASASGTTASVRFNNAASNSITLSGPGVINSGGILVTSTVAANTAQISGSTLTSGTNEIALTHNGTGVATISSNIIDNGAAVGFTKLGTGPLDLTGTNTYTGPTTFNGGAINITGDNSAATGTMSIYLSTVTLGNGNTSGTIGASSITIATGAAFNKTGSGSFTVGGPISGAGTITNTGGTLTLNGNISGGVTVAPTIGTTILSGTNSFNTQTNIGSAGTLAVGNNSAAGTGAIRFNAAGATLRALDATARTLSNTIDVANDSVIGSAGTGDLTFSGTFATGNGAKTLTINNTTTTVSGTITGGASTNFITKAGPGTLIFSNGGNSFVRPVSINAGILQIGAETHLGVAPAAAATNHLTFDGGTLLTTATFSIDDANRGITLAAGGGTFSTNASTTLTVANKITGTGALTKIGTGTLALTAGNDYSGTTTVTAGTLQLSRASGGASIVGNLLVNGGAANWTVSNQIADTASVTVDSGTIATGNLGDTIANLTVNSAALSTLSGLNITGTLTVTAGTQDLVNSNGTTTATTATFSGNSILRLGANSNQSTFNVGTGGLTMNSSTILFGNPGAIGQTATVSLAGDVSASGTNLFDVGTSTPVSKIDLGTATRTFNVTSGVTTVEPSFVSATATTGLTKTGNGTLALMAGTNTNGTSTYTGNTTVNAGTLLLQGVLSGTAKVDVSGTGTLAGTGTITPALNGNVNLLSGGKLAPGSSGAGTLNVSFNGGLFDLTAAVTPSATGSLLFELDTPATSDQVSLTGGALKIGSGVLEFNDFNFTALAGLTDNTDYVLFAGDTQIDGFLGANIGGPIGAFTGELRFADNNTDLIVHIPEPGSASLILAGISALGLIRRRREQVVRS